jgi:hypothetical protein
MNEFMALDLKCQKRRVSIHQVRKRKNRTRIVKVVKMKKKLRVLTFNEPVTGKPIKRSG